MDENESSSSVAVLMMIRVASATSLYDHRDIITGCQKSINYSVLSITHAWIGSLLIIHNDEGGK